MRNIFVSYPALVAISWRGTLREVRRIWQQPTPRMDIAPQGFHAVGAAFERNMEDGDTGAAFALYQSGAIKVDARWQVR